MMKNTTITLILLMMIPLASAADYYLSPTIIPDVTFTSIDYMPMIVVPSELVCGDKTCEGTETITACPSDCLSELPSYYKCMLNEDFCKNESVRVDSRNVGLITFTIILLLYLKYKKYL